MTRVSVVIPTKDRGPLLAQSLGTVLRQLDVDLEVVVVDDGSVSPARRWVSPDPRVRVVRNAAPTGVSAARNRGIAEARGEWIAFLDDDDVWAPDKLTAQLTAVTATGCDWAYTGEVAVDDGLRLRGGVPPPRPEEVVAGLEGFDAVPAGASNVFVQRGLLDHVGGFDPRLRTSEDWDMWIRLGRKALPACVARPLVAYRVRAGTASRQMAQALRDAELVARRHGIDFDRRRFLRWAAWTSLEDGRRTAAVAYYLRSAAAGDVRSVGRAVIATFHPGVVQRHTGPPYDPWLAQAREWLAEIPHVEPE
ncbi:MAG: glycosyltransferase [Nitriliruptorales bacterium]|nr:glycosyltransferase [Nitriliruptorales bacterium]